MSGGWEVEARGGYVVAEFRGHLGAEAGALSARRFAAHLLLENIDAVFDVRTMTGYDKEAREAWQKALWPHRKKLASITLVGGSRLVQMGGVVLGMALGVPVHRRAVMPGESEKQRAVGGD